MRTNAGLVFVVAIDLITVAGTSAGLPKEMFPHIESDLWELLAPLRDQMDAESRQAHIDRLKALPDWEERLAKAMVEIAIAARFDPVQPPSASEIGAFRRKYQLQEPLTEFHRQAIKSTQKDQAAGTAMEMYYLIETLAGLREEAVRFAAPLLAEQDGDFDMEDARIRSVRTCAVTCLGRLIRNGVVLAGNPPTSGDIGAWRAWWKANRQNYEPIPPALAVLEAEARTRGPAAAPVASPTPATPSVPTPSPVATPLQPGAPTPGVAPASPPAKIEVDQRRPWAIGIAAGAALLLLLAVAIKLRTKT